MAISRRVSWIRYGRRTVSLVCVLALAQGIAAQRSLADNPDDKGDHDRPPAQAKTLVSLPLSGTGIEAIVSFSKPSPALTSEPANTKIKDGTITVSVTGNGPLKLTAAPTVTRVLGNSRSKFAITGGSCSAGKELTPGENCTIKVRYEPANEGISSAHVTLTGSGGRDEHMHSENFDSN